MNKLKYNCIDVSIYCPQRSTLTFTAYDLNI